MTMTIDLSRIEEASPKTRRRVRYEYELENEALDCVFVAHHTKEFKLLMEGRVYSDNRWDHLPQYRRACLEAYVRGALDYAARMLGRPVSQPPDGVRPKTFTTPRSRRPSARAAKPAWAGASGVSYPAGVWDVPPARAAARKPKRLAP